jgi:hypothetical protein
MMRTGSRGSESRVPSASPEQAKGIANSKAAGSHVRSVVTNEAVSTANCIPAGR